jgi:hypothetical protein
VFRVTRIALRAPGGSSETVSVRTFASAFGVLVLGASLSACLSACASSEGPPAGDGFGPPDVVAGTRKVAASTARGAKAVGRSLGTAYRGVSQGFQGPADPAAYGAYPDDYVPVIRKHMLRFEGVDESASFEFGKPVRGYLNKGLLRGGEVEWQGWIVEVSIRTISAFGQPQTEAFVARLSDGDVVEVIEAAYAGALRRVPDAAPPAAAD